MSTIEQDNLAAVELIREVEGRGPTLPNGVHRNVPAAEYHAIEAVSSTLLKKFLRETPAHAKAMLDGKLSGDDIAMSKGTALHAALLEPSVFDAEYAIVPDCRRNSKEWKEHAEANPGKTLMKESENADVLGMRDQIWNDSLCRKLIEVCDERELTIIWTDETTGLQCKARIDLYSTTAGTMLDVKTTGSLDRFEKTAWKLAYHVQLAWYSRAIASTGSPARSIGILAVEQGVPYLPDVFEPSQDWFVRGHAAIEHAMPRVAQCMKTGNWPGYRTSKRPTPLDVPAWVNGEEL